MHTQERKQTLPPLPPPPISVFQLFNFHHGCHAKATLVLQSLALQNMQNISVNKNAAEESVLPIMLLQLNLYLVFPQLAYI